MRELFTNVIVNIQQAVMLNIDKISDVSVKVYDLNKMLSRTDYAVSHNTDAIETVESSVEDIENRLDYLESNTASDSSVHDLGVDIRDMTTKYNNIRRSHDEQYSNLIARICSIEKDIVKLGAYDEQDINTPAAIEMDRLDEELSKFIVDEFNK